MRILPISFTPAMAKAVEFKLAERPKKEGE